MPWNQLDSKSLKTTILVLLKTPQLFWHYLLYRWQSKNYMTCICRWVHCASDEMAWLESFFGLSWVPEKMPPKISQWWPPQTTDAREFFFPTYPKCFEQFGQISRINCGEVGVVGVVAFWCAFCHCASWVLDFALKLRFSESATKFEKMAHLDLTFTW